MRNSRKLLLLAVAAIGALAVALPASASASVWLHNTPGETVPVEEHIELTLTGGEVIEVGGSVLLCEASETITTEGGSSATITAYEINPSSCIGLAGGVAGCEVIKAKATNLPWNITVNAEDLTAEGVAVDYVFNAACPVHKIAVSFPALTLTLENEPSAIRYIRFSQEGTGEIDGEEAPLGYFGEFQLPEGEFDTYGIG